MHAKTKNLVFMGVNAALVCVATLVIRIPSVMGYKNLGDVFVLFAAMFFGPIGGAIAGGVGAGLADVIGGYAAYAPFTLVIKALEGLIAGYLFKLLARLKLEFHASVIISAVPAALVMAAGYFLTNYLFLNGEFAAALSDFVGDLLQGAIGVAGGVALIFALVRVPSIETVCGSSALTLYRTYASRGIAHKKALIISDLSGLGRCSLAAQSSIITASGHEPICLPTAILSAQTGFGGYKMISTSQALDEFPQSYDELGLAPAAVLTGYFADKSQLSKVQSAISRYKGTCDIVVDPIMGDDGQLYDGFDESLVEEMRALTQCATVITPNLTEACLLSGENYDSLCGMADKKELAAKVFALGEKLVRGDGNKVVITGIKFKKRIYNAVIDGDKRKLIGTAYRGASYSGTGDILSAVITGALMNKRSLLRGVKTAARLIGHAIADTEIEGTLPAEGINYQRFLNMLY